MVQILENEANAVAWDVGKRKWIREFDLAKAKVI